ncbi:MAG: UDP-N-acetylmuramate--L-alanine ligase [Muribaculaceae bacterium]|nr:UDP-N-acetylmuramate--L-alanine ligase [Muribaculaceae bacterium]
MELNNIYFIGIGGIGMAALARYFLSKGFNVAGYDRTLSALTEALVREGAAVSDIDSMDAVPEAFTDPDDTLVVYTPAVPKDNVQLRFFTDHGFNVMKRAAVLGWVTKLSNGICFAGTHGKTTTSSMAAHIMQTSSIGCNAFLGGILRNYGSNLLLSPKSPYSVIEADEYDRSFHHLHPRIAVITATDPDHLDIYGNEENYLESFAHFTELIDPDGYLILHEGLKLRPRPAEGVRTYTYSRDSGDFHAENIRYGEGTITFDFVAPDHRINDVELGVPVEINIENAVAAMAACHLTGCPTDDDMRRAMASFQGAERRFQFLLKQTGAGGKVVIDDYAHHPDELKMSIRSVKALYPDRKLTVAFQPHLYSRTRDFAAEFAEALSMADEVILTDIYPARELPIPGVTSKIIFDKINCNNKVLISKLDFVETIKNRNFDILLSLGAGDLSNLLPQVVDFLTDENKKQS